MRRWRERRQIQGAGWRRLDNTGKLFAMVTGEDLSNVFRVSAVLDREISPECLQRALMRTLPEFEVFCVRLRRGFFWYYFETNTREPSVEQETAFICRYIEPLGNQMYPFRVSYFGSRINFEVFHALTDGMGAMNFLKRLVEIYLEENLRRENTGAGPDESGKEQEPVPGTASAVTGSAADGSKGRALDGYLLHYRKREHTGYAGRRAFQLREKWLPLGQTAVYHGYVDLDRFKALCRREGVSMTKYLAALLLWSVIQVYLGGRTKKEPVAVNLPINLRAFFESDTLANFFAVTNISFPEERQPENFREVLAQVSRQMDEKIVRECLEETISYNVSREKKWYVRITPLALKTQIIRLIFLKNTRAYTLTLSNLGAVEMRGEFRDRIRDFHVLIGVSKKQPVKCGVAAYQDTADITFSSASRDRRLQDYFYGWLDEQGVLRGREENNAVASPYDRGNYPEAAEAGRIRKMMPWFYGALLLIAAVTGIVNMATYRWLGRWWSVMTAAGIAYAAMTVRFSLLRNSNLAGKIFRQSLGAIVISILIDWNLGYGGWAFNYAVPSILLFNVAAVGGLIAVNRLNWQSYFMYQIVITIFCLIPLVLWWAGLVTRPFLSLFTAGAALFLLCITAAAGSRSVKRELGRRFHL